MMIGLLDVDDKISAYQYQQKSWDRFLFYFFEF